MSLILLDQASIKNVRFSVSKEFWRDRDFYSTLHPLFTKVIELAKTAPASYKPPDRQRMLGDLLDSGVARLKKDTEPMEDMVLKDSGTVVSDGWDDAAKNHLINFLIGSSKGFFDASVKRLDIPASENTRLKMAIWIFDHMKTGRIAVE